MYYVVIMIWGEWWCVYFEMKVLFEEIGYWCDYCEGWVYCVYFVSDELMFVVFY